MGGDIDWGTVERLDGPLSDTDEQSEQLLDVPELTDDSLREMERELSDSETREATEPVQRAEPGSQAECEICGRVVRVRKDGELSRHKCEPKAQRGNRFDHLPSPRQITPRKAREFVITIAAWGIEEGSARALARPFGADPDDVPTELPDAEGMIGPPLDLVWPQIPDSARKFIEAAADNSDLIACALAWGDWLRTVSRWTREMRTYSERLHTQEEQRGTAQSAGTDGTFGRLVPFNPA